MPDEPDRRCAVGFVRPPPRLPVHTVLFVCHGNIMRSAFAEAAFRMIPPAKSTGVTSAGVRARAGRPADPMAIEVAGDFGLSLGRHQAQRVTQDMVGAADLIVVMDRRNEALLLADHPGAGDRVVLLGAFARDGDGSDEIADPYQAPRATVASCFARIERAVQALERHYRLG